MKNIACYIHVPFCQHKCIYCDFYSIIKLDRIEEYISSLMSEMDYYSSLYSEKYKIKTIFFGGGTPSILKPSDLHKIISHIKHTFIVDENAEITIEANPGTLDSQKLIELYKIGINRISIGVQSFNDKDLKYLTRIHNSKQAKAMIIDASNAGFQNISLDLIFNLPKQTKRKWLKNLAEAIQLPINHISCYSLIVEPGTILNKQILDGKVKLNDEDYDADLYESTIDFLHDNGFIQYEVSNFAKEGYQSLHNRYYWEYNNYIGFGPSAHSFMEGIRWNNFTSLTFYNNAISKNKNAALNKQAIEKNQMTEEFVLTGLRSTGIDLERLNKINDNWFEKNKNSILEFEKSEYLVIIDNKIKLTRKGFPLCDEILLKFNY